MSAVEALIAKVNRLEEELALEVQYRKGLEERLSMRDRAFKTITQALTALQEVRRESEGQIMDLRKRIKSLEDGQIYNRGGRQPEEAKSGAHSG